MTEQEEYCAVCDKLTTQRCADCKSAHYCSVECQTRDWNEGHELVCGTPEVGALFGIGSWKRIVEQHMRLSLELVDAIVPGIASEEISRKTNALYDHINAWSTRFLRSQDRHNISALLYGHQNILIAYIKARLNRDIEFTLGMLKSQLAPGTFTSNGTSFVKFWEKQGRQIGRWYTRARDYKDAWTAYTTCLINYVDTIMLEKVGPTHTVANQDCLNIARATGRVFDGGRWERPPKATVT